MNEIMTIVANVVGGAAIIIGGLVLLLIMALAAIWFVRRLLGY